MRHARNSCQPKYESKRKWIGHFCPHILTVQAYACAQTYPPNDDDNHSDGDYSDDDDDDATDRHFRTNLHISVSFITKICVPSRSYSLPHENPFSYAEAKSQKAIWKSVCSPTRLSLTRPILWISQVITKCNQEKTRNRTLFTIVAK